MKWAFALLNTPVQFGAGVYIIRSGGRGGGGWLPAGKNEGLIVLKSHLCGFKTLEIFTTTK